MTYTLDAFVKDAQAALKAHAGPAGREQVRVLLEKLLTNRAFVDEYGLLEPNMEKMEAWYYRLAGRVGEVEHQASS